MKRLDEEMMTGDKDLTEAQKRAERRAAELAAKQAEADRIAEEERRRLQERKAQQDALEEKRADCESLEELLATFERDCQGGNAPLSTKPPNDGYVFFTEDPLEAVQNWCENNCVDQYEDSEFGAVASSICSDLTIKTNPDKYKTSKQEEADNARWVRPTEMESMTLFGEDGGLTVGSVEQGSLGDCWLVALIASVAQSSPANLTDMINPKTISPIGCYSVRFYVDGLPRWVLIDDQFPAKDSEKIDPDSFIYCHGQKEIWPNIIEKAFAKWTGAYENLTGGTQT